MAKKCYPNLTRNTRGKIFMTKTLKKYEKIQNIPIYAGDGQILDFEALFNFSIDKCKRYVHVPLGNKG